MNIASIQEAKAVGDQSEAIPQVWLIIEDDAAIRQVLVMTVEMMGFQAVALRDGSQALAYLQESQPQPLPEVALIDIRMPGVWGHEVGAQLRQHSRLGSIPMFLMTAYELEEGEAEEYLRVSGADQMLAKPLPPLEDVISLVQRIRAGRDGAA